MYEHNNCVIRSSSHLAPRRQQGAALVVSLIILLVMTVIAISSMQSTTLDERMVGNMRDKGIALQAAESALREGEDKAEDPSTAISSFTGTSGYYSKNANIDVFSSTTWSGSNSKEYAGSLNIGESITVAAKPRYILQYRGIVPTTGLVTGTGYVSPNKHAIRTISRGNGLTGNTEVFLQSDSIVLR